MTETFNFAYKVGLGINTGVQNVTFGDSAEVVNGRFKGNTYTIALEPLVVYRDDNGNAVMNNKLNNIVTFLDFVRRHTRPAKSFYIKINHENDLREVYFMEETITVNAEGANGAREGISFGVRDKFW